jgi:metallopeptidase MepB
MLDDDHGVSKQTLIIRLFSSVSEDKDLRDASRTAEEMLLKANSEALMRRDIAALVKAVYEKHRRGDEKLGEEDAYTLFKTHRAYQNTGAGIEDEDVREKYKAAVQERNEVLVAARKTISESDEGIFFTREQLNGVPSSILDAMKKNDDGLLKATFKKGHMISIMKHATSAQTRKAYNIAKESRFPENVTRLERAVELRNSTARMLGFKTHAELKMQDKMAKSVESVMEMLNKLRTELKPLAHDEMKTLFEIKKAYIHDNGTDEDGDDVKRLNAWDWAFYARILEKERYSVDSLLISEYFEVNHSLKGMLNIFEEIFGMVFIPTDAPVWQKDVAVYEAWNAEDQGGEFLGYLYLDLYAREGKYAGAHSSLIQPVSLPRHNERRYLLTVSGLRNIRQQTPLSLFITNNIPPPHALPANSPPPLRAKNNVSRARPRNPQARNANQPPTRLRTRLCRDPQHSSRELDLGALCAPAPRKTLLLSVLRVFNLLER